MAAGTAPGASPKTHASTASPPSKAKPASPQTGEGPNRAQAVAPGATTSPKVLFGAEADLGQGGGEEPVPAKKLASMRDVVKKMEKDKLVKEATKAAQDASKEREQLWMQLAVAGCVFSVSSVTMPGYLSFGVLLVLLGTMSRRLSTAFPEMKETLLKELGEQYTQVSTFATAKLRAISAPFEAAAAKLASGFGACVTFCRAVAMQSMLVALWLGEKILSGVAALRDGACKVAHIVSMTPAMLRSLPALAYRGTVNALLGTNDLIWRLIEQDFHKALLPVLRTIFECAVVADLFLPFDIFGPAHEEIRGNIQGHLRQLSSEPGSWCLEHRSFVITASLFLVLFYNPDAIARRKGRRPEPWF